MPTAPTLPIVLFTDAEAFSSWLATHHRSSPGLWLQLAKKGKPLRSLTYSEAVDVALMWGWIDSQKRAHDENSWLQRFTPRGPRSLWSQVNRERVAALSERGAMQPAGLAEVERARADGRWDAAYAPASRIEVPAALTAALARNPAAQAAFAGLDAANRYAMLWRLHTAKKPETRERQIARFVEMLARGGKIHE